VLSAASQFLIMVAAQVIGMLVFTYLTNRRFRERVNATAAETAHGGLRRTVQAVDRLAADLAASPYRDFIVALIALGLAAAVLGSGHNAVNPSDLAGWAVTAMAAAEALKRWRRRGLRLTELPALFARPGRQPKPPSGAPRMWPDVSSW
jgi:glycerol uptake facilitator-like aquaporin